MDELEDFLNFVFENLGDPRVEFYKKMKYGHRNYFININLNCDQSITSRDFKTLQIIVDCRNGCIEVGKWEEFTVFEDVELTKKWADKFEELYKKNIASDLKSKIHSFFNNVDPKDKDFGRRWKMKDWFNDDNEKENLTE